MIRCGVRTPSGQAPTSLSAATDEGDKGDKGGKGGKDGAGCAPFGSWASGEMPSWVEDRLEDRGLSDRRDAIREIWQAARDGDYGATVAALAEDGPFGYSRGPGRGCGPGRGGHGGPWGR